jgi:hypothetical protein
MSDDDHAEVDSNSEAEEEEDVGSNSPARNDGRNHAVKKRKHKRVEHAPGYYDEVLWEQPTIRGYKGPQVHWTTLSGRKWANESLLKYLPHPEIANLIDWAHHKTPTNDQHHKKPAHDEREPNPLLEAELGSPLPQSQLNYIQEKARDLVRGKPDNPNISKAKVMDASMKCILESFDNSAAVAMGVMLEEMITANLLPLAEAHVQRCRYLEEQYNPQQQVTALPRNLENPSFQQWTLPPEEAIFNTIVSSLSTESNSLEGSLGRLPSTCPPNRTFLAPQPGDESGSESDPKQQSAFHFCQRQGLTSRFVRRNMDIYRWFLASMPEEGDDSGQRKRRKYRSRAKPKKQNAAAK